jgi:hypothetical protein
MLRRAPRAGAAAAASRLPGGSGRSRAAAQAASPRIRAVNLGRDRPAAGCAGVRVVDKPDWREAGRRMWQEVAEAPPGADAGMQSLLAGRRRSLDTFGSARRVFATATAR